jgi:hypothetical protein
MGTHGDENARGARKGRVFAMAMPKRTKPTMNPTAATALKPTTGG